MDDKKRKKTMTAEWSNLPTELWLEISKHLYSPLDVLRFRSTCRFWRTRLPLPFPSSYFPCIPHRQFRCLFQTKTYRLEPLSSISNSKGWIIKVTDGESKPFCLLDPFTNARLSSRKVLNLMNFRVVELFQSYTLKPTNSFITHGSEDMFCSVRKLVLFPVKGVRMLFTLYTYGVLRVSRIGDHENFGRMPRSNYHDITVHKEHLYVVDDWGTIWWLNCSSFPIKMVQFSPMMYTFGTNKKHLVECNGSLYRVDTWRKYGKVHDVKVYKLDEEGGRKRWLDVKDLGDVVFVLGKDLNFSLSAKHYYGCQGNCVYLYIDNRVCSFSLETSKFDRSPTSFWHCPTLFNSNFNL